MAESSPRSAAARLGLLVATCGPVGFAPVAPGTFGSAVGIAVFYAMRAMGGAGLELAVIVGLFAVGVWSAGVAERVLARTDPGPVVIDEVLGVLITLAFLPVNGAGALAGFFVFRALDIIKPWPASRFEALHGGLGVMADDAMAALYGNLVMRALIALAPGWLV